MKQRLGIILVFVLAIGILIAINAFAYVQESDNEDSELAPNRSSYNARATGTRAFYDFLNESGYKVTRWREPPEKLLAAAGADVKTFVIIGRPVVSIEEEEAKSLLLWVKQGGNLVLIDRRPEQFLLPQAGDWTVTTEFIDYPTLDTDPADQKQMTQDVKPSTPVQPTTFTQNVKSVLPSRYYSAIKFFPANNKSAKDEPVLGETAPAAPVVHLVTGDKNLLVDYPYGQGRIAVLSDPFMVANTGINLGDNLQLAINLVNSRGGLIAFDEFHQGRAATHNAFINYFAGTPILALAGQLALLILLMLWTRGRRFARPLPLPHVDRRSSLEFVASMAELQQRAKAFDLAIENVYARTRRVLARYAGVDYNTSRTEIANRVASRSSLDAHRLETLMKQSEEAINGAPISEKQSLQLVKRLREVESALGLRMRSREIKQSAQNI
ncbi:MAG TPA: DUF4350 domain-containing protein [Pyrinomonadaceae bacterium]|nr:DUF4350 domain-containing protein [Pyrinomonadaceae bacterium]